RATRAEDGWPVTTEQAQRRGLALGRAERGPALAQRGGWGRSRPRSAQAGPDEGPQQRRHVTTALQRGSHRTKFETDGNDGGEGGAERGIECAQALGGGEGGDALAAHPLELGV
ncbi:hypothetical protein VM98_36255, partial [Streptomyces rubellomurinus subsp. indigoferus]